MEVIFGWWDSSRAFNFYVKFIINFAIKDFVKEFQNYNMYDYFFQSKFFVSRSEFYLRERKFILFFQRYHRKYSGACS